MSGCCRILLALELAFTLMVTVNAITTTTYHRATGNHRHAKRSDVIVFGSDENSFHCRNPNGLAGRCIPLYACEPLHQVLLDRNASSSARQFVRQSHCIHSGAGKFPEVCCTGEWQFNDKQQRIVFPQGDDADNVGDAVDAVDAVDAGEAEADESEFVGRPEPREHREESDDKVIDSLYATSAKLINSHKFPQPPDCGKVVLGNKIVGGIETSLREFAWMVNLEYQTPTNGLVSVCAGSLINAYYVLTVGHCVRGTIELKVGKLVSVRVGDHDESTELDCRHREGCIAPYQRLAIAEIMVHERMGDATEQRVHQHNDLALLLLERRIDFTSSVQPICLPRATDPPLQPGLKLIVAGWGHNGTVKRTAEKHKVWVPYVEQEECRLAHKAIFHVADEQLCAGGMFRKDSCTGDSGGPLMRLGMSGWILEGLVSFGYGCGLLDKPAIYTRVRSYLPWIERNVRVH